jgi:anaerobic selenocysteine-containing dehydrogenase
MSHECPTLARARTPGPAARALPPDGIPFRRAAAIGRLTAPMRLDAATDKYVEVSWHEAFADIGTRLKALEPKSTVFYVSGRAALETSYMVALMARLYGSSNMCQGSTSAGLPGSIGVPVGMVQLEDFEQCDCIVIMGHNIGEPSRQP